MSIKRADDGWDFFYACNLRSTPTALTGNNAIFGAVFSDDDRLQNAVLGDRICERFELLWLKIAAWLIFVWLDVSKLNLNEFA